MPTLKGTIAELVDEWLQGEPTPERQQNMCRTSLVVDLQAAAERAVGEAYEAGYRDGAAETPPRDLNRQHPALKET